VRHRAGHRAGEGHVDALGAEELPQGFRDRSDPAGRLAAGERRQLSYTRGPRSNPRHDASLALLSSDARFIELRDSVRRSVAQDRLALAELRRGGFVPQRSK
jgi:hypothetical protein